MNKSIWGVLALSLLVSACGPGDKGPGDTRRCSNAPQVTVNVRGANLVAVPENICVYRGETLIIKIVPPQALDTVFTKPDGANPGDDDWLDGQNGSFGDLVLLSVPTDMSASPNGSYKYSIDVGGVVLDPHATIIDR